MPRCALQWQHGALFASIVGATDALAISTVLHRAGGPEHTVTLLEGESLLNDASALTLFKLLHAAVIKAAEDGPGSSQPLSHLLPAFALDITTLSVGGAAFGLCIGVVAQRTLRMLRWHSASSAQETATILALAYLTYYIADEVLGVSGVIAVVVFGLYGNSQGHFSIGGTQREREARSVLTALSFALNGLAFFFAGASSVNFTVRYASNFAAPRSRPSVRVYALPVSTRSQL